MEAKIVARDFSVPVISWLVKIATPHQPPLWRPIKREGHKASLTSREMTSSAYCWITVFQIFTPSYWQWSKSGIQPNSYAPEIPNTCDCWPAQERLLQLQNLSLSDRLSTDPWLVWPQPLIRPQKTCRHFINKYRSIKFFEKSAPLTIEFATQG